MAKIGRNEKCPCQSGKKFKNCCGRKELEAARPKQQQSMQVTLMEGVRRIQEDAAKKKPMVRELGVFFFYTTTAGDAWLLEMTDCDAIQVAQGGEALAPPIDENSDTIEINWSHRFKLENKQLIFTAYADKSVMVMEGAPTRELNGAIRRIYKRFTSEQLGRVHLPAPEEDGV